ncbi:MAG: hypothetical protein V4510_05130 [bacterium]
MQMQRVDVNVGTLHNVEEVLRAASVPVSRYFILERLKEAGRATNQPRLNVAIAYLCSHELAIEGERGIQWTQSGSAALRRAAAAGRRV